MAKGVEDTAFYRYNRLSSLTEVGGDPAEFSIGVAEFHRRQLARQASQPGLADHAHHARHQARRRHPGPHQRAERDPGPLGHHARPAARPRAARRWRPRRPALGVDRGRVAGLARAPPRLRHQGVPRGGVIHHVDPTQRTVRKPDARHDRRGLRRPRRRRGRERVRRRHRTGRMVEFADRQADPADGARHPGRLPGQRAVGDEPRRPRQPSAGRLRRCGAPCSQGSRASCPRSTSREPRSSW